MHFYNTLQVQHTKRDIDYTNLQKLYTNFYSIFLLHQFICLERIGVMQDHITPIFWIGVVITDR